ncbi:MAG: CHAT domain-containing protein [Byssovorax sp.]
MSAIEPHGFRAGLAAAELALLRGRLTEAQTAVEHAASRCEGDDACGAAATVLRTLIVTEQISTFHRLVQADVLRSKGHDIDVDKLDADARDAVPRVDAPLRRAAAVWYMASKIRFVRAGYQAIHYFITPGEEGARDVSAARQLPPADDSEVVKMLRWSLSPVGPPPDAGEALRAAAALLQADRLLAPNGGAISLDVHVLGGAPDRSTWYNEGLSSPLERHPTPADVQAARALLADEGAFRHGSLLAPAREHLLAYLDVLEGRPAESRRRLDLAREGFRAAGAPSAEAGTALLSAALHVDAGETKRAIEVFREGFALVDGSGAVGRGAAMLTVIASVAERVFHLGQRYPDGTALTGVAADMAVEHGYLDQAVRLASMSIDLMNDLSFPQGVLQLAPSCHRVFDTAIQGYKAYGSAQQLSGASAKSMVDDSIRSIGMLRASLLQSEAVALANLGAQWSKIDERMSAFEALAVTTGLGGAIDPKTHADHMRRVLQAHAALARGDVPSAIGAAKGDPELRELTAAIQGQPADPEVLERDLRDQEAAVAAAARASGSAVQRYLNMVLQRQALVGKRERYITACERLRSPRQARKVLDAWLADPLSAAIAQSRPYRRLILEGQVLTAEAKPAEAAAAYDRAIEMLRERVVQGQRRDRHKSTTGPEVDAYAGRARVALLGHDALTALDKMDELRWLRDQQEDVSRPPGAPPALDLEGIERQLHDGTIVAIADVGDPTSIQAWIWSRKQGLRTRAFRNAKDGTALARGVELVAFGEPLRGPARDLATWIDRETPRDRPIVLAVSPILRAAGLHLLPVRGEPLALRNPLLYAPSLRELRALVDRAGERGGDRLVIGMPVTANTSRAALGEMIAMGSETELRGLAADRFLWDAAATVPLSTKAMAHARRIHISSHGRIDELDASNTGIVLFGGEILSLTNTSRLSLAGPLVVLSACQSGLQVHPSTSGIPALDRVFLFAGARSVISTPWAVPADAAAMWTSALHRELDAGVSVMEAARRAYAHTRKTFPQATSWGAFSIVGAGNGPA